MQWPVAEALAAYEARVIEELRDDYRHRLLVWAVTAPYSEKKTAPPQPPELLKG